MRKTRKVIIIFILEQLFVWRPGLLTEIKLLKCDPPDFPKMGGYGPHADSYLPGDRIVYYCETESFISGNIFRMCMDNGDWAGDTPVCDVPANFQFVKQRSTATPTSVNEAVLAIDGLRHTCSKTFFAMNENELNWLGFLDIEGEVLRVMLFLPKGRVSYQVWIVRSDGTRQSCGGSNKTIEIYEWTFHNCPKADSKGITLVKIVSEDGNPLKLCEVLVFILTEPYCSDPHYQIVNGRLALSRKKADLVCKQYYTRGNSEGIECLRTGVWSRTQLYCEELNEDDICNPVTESIPNGRLLFKGTVADLECDRGFKPVSKTRIVCRNAAWNTSGLLCSQVSKAENIVFQVDNIVTIAVFAIGVLLALGAIIVVAFICLTRCEKSSWSSSCPSFRSLGKVSSDKGGSSHLRVSPSLGYRSSSAYDSADEHEYSHVRYSGFLGKVILPKKRDNKERK